MMLVFYGGMAGAVAFFEWTDTDTQDKVNIYPPGVFQQERLYGVALAHGLILGIWIYAGASNGGDCHFNPAVTLGFMFLRKCGCIKGLTYMVAQLIGSFLG